MASPNAEARHLAARIRWLIESQQVRPQDILILARTKRRVYELADVLTRETFTGTQGVHVAINEKDKLVARSGMFSICTVASAKGYDAHAVLIASAEQWTGKPTDRATFYVGCTRARDYLEISACGPGELFTEMRDAIQWCRSQGEGGS
ncbi:MAG: hypothetical protein AAF750_07575 [Planctomycetota bacterium]